MATRSDTIRRLIDERTEEIEDRLADIVDELEDMTANRAWHLAHRHIQPAAALAVMIAETSAELVALETELDEYR